MKFLENPPLDSINDFLTHIPLGDCTIQGSIETYSCKHTGADRKQSLSLEHEILEYLGQSCDSNTPSPVDFLCCRSSRKTLIYLVLTLNHMHPDYDFSAVQTQQFFREETWESFTQIYEMYLSEVAKEWAEGNDGSSLMESLSKALDEVVRLQECEIYSYNPDSDVDPFLESGALWSFNYFFYNRKLKRVVSFRLCCVSNSEAEGFLTDGDCDEDIFDNMDM